MQPSVRMSQMCWPGGRRWAQSEGRCCLLGSAHREPFCADTQATWSSLVRVHMPLSIDIVEADSQLGHAVYSPSPIFVL